MSVTTSSGDIIPRDEVERLAAVRRYDILDTPPDGAFDRVAALASRLTNAPISTITVVDEDRIWFKTAYGIQVNEVTRDPGLCASAILQDTPFVVTDAQLDPRALNNPLVRGELGLRFYVGAPLRTSDGYNLGTLNVIDVEPRGISGEELDTLSALAAIVVDELELRLAARRTIELEATKKAAKLRDALIAEISHEMLTPLAILEGIATLVETSEGDDGGDLGTMRVLFRQQTRRLHWLINRFREYARLEGGQVPEVRTDTFDLAEVSAAAAARFTGQTPIEPQVAADTPLAVGDADRTLDILLELFHKAAGSGDVPVTASVKPGDEGTAQVAVTGHGPSVNSGDRHRLLDERHDRSDGGNTGIGLHVSRLFAEAQGGRIDCGAAAGGGRRFILVLPAVH